MEYREFKGKNLDEAVTEAAKAFGVKTEDVIYEVIEKGSLGFLGIGAKPAVIKATAKEQPVEEVKEEIVAPVKEETAAPIAEESYDDEEDDAEDSYEEKPEKKIQEISPEESERIVTETKQYLEKLFAAMEIEATIDIHMEEKNELAIDVEGPDMGILIGKRGQTLDSLQYLISLYVNKKSESYIRVKLDTENYRERRKETLENLAKNIAFKVKKSRKSFTLEPMNPYERRIIHSTLQNDKFVSTKSEGEEPYRRVVIFLKKKDNKGGYGKSRY